MAGERRGGGVGACFERRENMHELERLYGARINPNEMDANFTISP
jgi:hypothetical protein